MRNSRAHALARLSLLGLMTCLAMWFAAAPAVADIPPDDSSTVAPQDSPNAILDKRTITQTRIYAEQLAPAARAKFEALTDQAKLDIVRAAMADEAERQRPKRSSGFWMNGRPAKGGAYYYPLLLIGLGVLAITMFTIIRYLRRIERERQARH